MDLKSRREFVMDSMTENSVLVLYSDSYGMGSYNNSFFYLTGLTRSKMILLMVKAGAAKQTTLFIEEADPFTVRWMGKRMSVEEAKEISGIDDVAFLGAFDGRLARVLSVYPEAAYFDCSPFPFGDLLDFNAAKAKSFGEKHPGIQVKDVTPFITRMRMQKDEGEVEKLREAVRITDEALKYVLKTLKPGMMEYQAQANFEYMVHYQGADDIAFPTIAGSGINGTMLHYGDNICECKDGDLILMDLGAKYKGYCSDITRTYPVNGKFSPRQRQVYDIVLKANREVAKQAKAGMTTKDLQELTKHILGQGCIELGLIKDESEVTKYYMHSVSHHLGIDVHDVNLGVDVPMEAGTVISDEPGLYIDEWEIGIRIEDDLFITEDGCVCLSEQIMRDPDEIEKFMAENKA